MKVATILPQNYLHLTQDDDYLMCLGHLIGAPGMEKYTEFFTQASKEGKFIIMDNGLIEGDPRPITELAEKANYIGASEMIMTDVFRDKDATLKAIDEGIKALDNAGIKHPKLMLVPQGNSVVEWVECAHEIICKYPQLDYTIGVPKVLVHLGGRDGRVEALINLVDRCPVARHKTFHLLGCWTTPLEVTIVDKLVRQGVLPNVRGVDSAIPFVYARAGSKINSQDRPDSNPINFKFTKVKSFLLRYNIYLWRKAADSSRRWF